MSSQSSNAVLAKARAMYGRCLKDEDYRKLAECRTVTEVASYLKNNTSYGKVLRGINEGEIHRSRLEPILREELYYEIEALSRYESDHSLGFTQFMRAKLDIDQLVRCLILLNLGRPEDYLYTMPLSLDPFTDIHLGELAKVRSYSDVLSLLRNTRYYPVLLKYKPADGEKINIAELEVALNNLNYQTLYDAIRSFDDSSDKREIQELFSSMFDFENVERIIRLKKYYKMDSQKIKTILIPNGKLSKKKLDKLCEADDEGEVFELARSTYLGRMMSRLTYNDRSQMTEAMVCVYCKHHLRLSPNPTIVMVSYVYLKSIELKNIVNIIEAARYGISAEEKTRLLVK